MADAVTVTTVTGTGTGTVAVTVTSTTTTTTTADVDVDATVMKDLKERALGTVCQESRGLLIGRSRFLCG